MKTREIIIDFRNITKEQLHDILSLEFAFIDGYGRNWDALIDCLSCIRRPCGLLNNTINDDEVVLFKCLLEDAYKSELFLQFVDCLTCVNGRLQLSGQLSRFIICPIQMS